MLWRLRVWLGVPRRSGNEAVVPPGGTRVMCGVPSSGTAAPNAVTHLTLFIGQYAQRQFLGARRKPSLAATLEAWQEYAPKHLPLPHPSPRNQPWFKRHPWFERQLVRVLRTRIAALSAR